MNQWIERITATSRISRRDFFLLIFPLVLWSGLLLLRPSLISPSCQPAAAQESSCRPETVISVDRVALGLNSSEADGFSYFTQNLSGVLAFAGPVLWTGGQILMRGVAPAAALSAFAVDIVILTETMLWNGAVGETFRITSQRPRPFVYADPAAAGPNPAHYISFYSGHTSFAAACTFALFLFLLGKRAPAWLLAISFAGFEVLTFATGIFRVLAGRHFITDVVVAAVAGSAIAFVIAWLHRAPVFYVNNK